MTLRSEQLSNQFTSQFASQFAAPFSAIGKSQFEAQLGALQSFGNRAIESAEQLISLNLRASRTSVEQVTGTFKQLLDATNPRDVIAVGSRVQGQWHYLFDYGRELLSIASGAPLQAWSTQQPASFFPALQLSQARTQTQAAADAAPAVDVEAAAHAVSDTVSQVLDQASIATADFTTVTSEIASAASDVADREVAAAAVETAEAAADLVDNGSAAAYTASAQAVEAQPAEAQHDEPPAAEQQAVEAPVDEAVQQFEAAVDHAIADEGPAVKETPLAQALHELAPKPAGAEHPVASTIALEAHDHVELPVVTPVDATPPPATPAPAPKEQRRSPRPRK